MAPVKNTEDHADGKIGTEELLERLIVADPLAWETLLDRIEQRLRVLLHFRLPTNARVRIDPEDILQNTFLDAIKGISGFEYRGPGSLQRWFSQILIHRIQQEQARTSRLPTPNSTDGRELAMEFESNPRRPLVQWIAAHATPSSEARHRERVARIRDVVERLPETEREVVLLVVYEGLNNAEAGHRLGVDPSTISVRLKRAMARCATRLRELTP